MDRLARSLALGNRHLRTLQTQSPATGRAMYLSMAQSIATNDVVGAWGWYQQLLRQRDLEKTQNYTANRLLFTQTPRSQSFADSAQAHVREAHTKILRMLRVKYIHGYTPTHLKQLTQWAMLFLRESAADGCVLSPQQINDLLALFAVQRNGDAADHVWQHATLSGATMDVTNYNAYINACTRARNYDRAFEVVRELRRRGFQPNTWTQAYLVRLYGLSGDLESARREFVHACRLSKWGAIGRDADRLRNVYWQDKTNDLRVFGVNIFICIEMLGVLGRNGLMDEMRELLLRVLGLNGIDVDSISNRALRKTISTRGIRPNMRMFHEVIGWHATYWDMDAAVGFVHLMSRCGIPPVPKTLKLIVNKVTASRDVAQCAKVALMMHEKYGIELPRSTMRTIKVAKAMAVKMQEQIEEAEAQNPTFFQTLSNLTGLS
ncbi:hypothetical protein GGF43_000340, partial [Coemansia sp. RSA 2618]